MVIWQADFHRILPEDKQGQIFWELIICDVGGKVIHEAKCPQSQANSDWLTAQLQTLCHSKKPDVIQVFRPQSLGLLTVAAQKHGIKIEPTRRTRALKEILEKRCHSLTHLEQLPPQSLPENIWGEQWRFATFLAADFVTFFQGQPIPIFALPDALLPINLGLASTVALPGIVIYGGRKSMYLAQWLEAQKPVAINYIPTGMGKSGGLVLESGLVDRWILATFEDADVAAAAKRYEEKKKVSNGLHFLIIQPDDSGVTYTGVWLLKQET